MGANVKGFGRGGLWPPARLTRMLAGAVLLVATVGSGAGDAPRASAAQYGRFCGSGAPIRSVSTTQRAVAFTFDDGPSTANTARIMSTMESYGWRATFFMVGVNVRLQPALARSIAARGHTVAAHSTTHVYSPSTLVREVPASQALIHEVTGVRPTFWRTPGLTISSSVDAAVYANGMCNISTAYDLGDWRSPRASASTLCARYRYALKPGAIILLHDGGGYRPTTDALACMLQYTRQQGYTVVHLGDLLSGNFTGPSTPPPPPPPTPAPTSGCATSAYGSRGTAVASAQRVVMAAGIYLRGGADGIYGSYTMAAVKVYQSRQGLPVTGAVDEATARAMGLCTSSAPTTPVASGAWTVVQRGQRGPAVAAVQRAVINSGIYLYGGADGIFGAYTEAAVKKYQEARGLPATGVVDAATAQAMGLYTPPATTTTMTTTTAPPTSAMAVPGATTTTTTTVSSPTSTTTTTTTTVSSSSSTTTSSTAATTLGAIGDNVWLDADGDGLRSANEGGVPGVDVRLRNSQEVEVASMLTGVSGQYRFDGLAQGTYIVEFVLPDGFGFSPGDVGTDDERDSDTASVVVRDVQQETVARAPVTIGAGAEDLTIDAGLVERPAAAPLSVTNESDSTADETDTTAATSSQRVASSAPPTTTSATIVTSAPVTTSSPQPTEPAPEPPLEPVSDNAGGTG